MRPLPSAFPPPCSPLAPPAAVSSLEAAPAVCAAAASRRLRNSSSCEHVSALLPSSSLPCSSSVFCHVPCVFQHPDRHVAVDPWRSEAVDVRGSKWNANSTVFGFERLSLNSKVNIAGLEERGAPTRGAHRVTHEALERGETKQVVRLVKVEKNGWRQKRRRPFHVCTRGCVGGSVLCMVGSRNASGAFA